VDFFQGPRVPEERRAEIHARVHRLWESLYPWIHWND
jgi:hypothetical protein